MSEKPESDSPYEFAPRAEPAKPVEPAGAAPGTFENPEVIEVEELQIERICPHCGFKIMGKPRGGRCPECAAALDEVATDLLQFSDRHWLATMSNGTFLFAISIVVQVVAIGIVWRGGVRFGNALHILGALASAAGLWMASTSEPHAGIVRTPLAPLVRLIGIVVAALWLVVVFGAPAGALPGLNRAQVLITLLLFAAAAQAIIVALHLRMLARRVPNDGLGAQLFNSAVLFAGCCLLMVGVNGLNIGDSPTPFFFFCVPAGGVIAVILAWTIWTILRMAMEFRHCAVAGQTIVERKAMRAAAANAPRPERT